MTKKHDKRCRKPEILFNNINIIRGQKILQSQTSSCRIYQISSKIMKLMSTKISLKPGD